jgi:hypothetical protein
MKSVNKYNIQLDIIVCSVQLRFLGLYWLEFFYTKKNGRKAPVLYSYPSHSLANTTSDPWMFV